MCGPRYEVLGRTHLSTAGRKKAIVSSTITASAYARSTQSPTAAASTHYPWRRTHFSTDQAGSAWTMTGYTLALAAVIPLSSWPPHVSAPRRFSFGTKKVYLTSLVLFVLGSVTNRELT